MNKKFVPVGLLFSVLFLLSKPLKAEEQEFKEHFKKANELFKKDKKDEAIFYYNKTIEANPNCHQAYFNKGLVLANRGDLVGAENSYRNALEVHSHYKKAHLMLGDILKQQEKNEQARETYEQLLQLDPYHFEGHLHLARVLSDLRAFPEAIEHFEKALSIKPNNLQCKLDLANTLNMANQTEEALRLYRELEDKLPQSTSIIYNIAYTLKKLGYIEEAIPYYHKVLELNPDHAEAHFGLGLSHLMQENFLEGWKEYEWRWKRTRYTPRNFRQPQWDGSDLHGKTILLHAEQGLGDTYQFVRFAKIAKEHGGMVIVAAQNPLVQILSECDYIDQVVSLHSSLPPFDVHASLMSLPLILKTEVVTIPADIPYLFSKDELVELWEKNLSSDTNFKIGICWQGNPNYSTPFLRNAVAAKSIQLAQLAPISEIPGVSLYCLQKTTGEEQLNNLPEGFHLHVFGPDFDKTNGRFMDTSAVMKNLDLVLTVDTSIAHLAGGLGVPVWVILPEPADWRWMLRESDTPWYPNMKLFRQPRPDDWESVIQTVVNELKKKVGLKKTDQTKKFAHLTTEKLIETVAQLEIQVSTAEDNNQRKNIEIRLNNARRNLDLRCGKSSQRDSLLEKFINVTKKLWQYKMEISRLSPGDEEFASTAQSTVTLCTLKDNIMKQILTVV